jgi:hypothetical protein
MRTEVLFGVILFLVALFPLNYAHTLAGSPSFWVWAGIIACLWVFDVLFQVSWRLWFPPKDENAKEQ